MPDYAIIDPQFTMTAPPKITAATGLDALTHAAEAYTSKLAQPLSDTFALSAIKRIFKYLPVAFHDGKNVEAREQMSIAALEAGNRFQQCICYISSWNEPSDRSIIPCSAWIIQCASFCICC